MKRISMWKQLPLMTAVALSATAVNCSFGPSYTPGMASDQSQLNAPLQPPAGALTSDSIQVTKYIKLYYEKVGAGDKLLFIHGGPGIPNRPEGGLTKISGFEVYFYHARGTGKSTRPIIKFEEDSWSKNPGILERQLGMSAQVADIERIRRALGEEKLRIMGLSYGGLIATMYATEFPDKVRSLILINPASIKFNADDKDSNLFAQIGHMQDTEQQKKEYGLYMNEFFETFRTIWKQDEASLRALLGRLGPYYFRAANKKGMKLPAKNIPPDWPGGWHSFALFFSAGKEYDYTGAVKEKVKAPVLLLLGDKDITGLETYAPYRTALPGVKEVVIRGAGHFPHVDKPAEFAKNAGSFLTNN